MSMQEWGRREMSRGEKGQREKERKSESDSVLNVKPNEGFDRTTKDHDLSRNEESHT